MGNRSDTNQQKRKTAGQNPGIALRSIEEPITWLHFRQEHEGHSLSTSIFPGVHWSEGINQTVIIKCFVNDLFRLRYEISTLDFRNGDLITLIGGDIDEEVTRDDVSLSIDSHGNCVVFYTKIVQSQKIFHYRTGILNTIDGEIIWGKSVKIETFKSTQDIWQLESSLRVLNNIAYCVVSWKQGRGSSSQPYYRFGRLFPLNEMPVFIIVIKDEQFIFCTLALAPGCKVTIRSDFDVLEEVHGLDKLLVLESSSSIRDKVKTTESGTKTVWEYRVIGKPKVYDFHLKKAHTFVVSSLGVMKAEFRIIGKCPCHAKILPTLFSKESKFLLTREGTNEEVKVKGVMGDHHCDYVLPEGMDAKVCKTPEDSGSLFLTIENDPCHSSSGPSIQQNQTGEEADLVILDSPIIGGGIAP